MKKPKAKKVEKVKDDPYSHINKYIDVMQGNKGKRIEIIITGEGCNSHFIFNSWKHCLIGVAQLYSHKEGSF
tara:strand:+ start:77 stop:292 length:216 start_codon:yes stop_codon:yes gene_type:complete